MCVYVWSRQAGGRPYPTYPLSSFFGECMGVFARSVPAGKVVDALSALEGVKKEVLEDFSSTLLKAIGTSVGKGETETLAWTVGNMSG